MLMTGSGPIDAERAFSRVARRLRREPAEDGRLPIYDERTLRVCAPGRRSREIPLDAISGTVEPCRATLFDRRFRPAGGARCRWQRSADDRRDRGHGSPGLAAMRHTTGSGSA